MQTTARTETLRLFGFGLLGAGLLAHVLAAQAIGGTWIAYRDHLLGFAGLTLVAWGILAAAGRWFWRSRPEVTVLALGAVQALLGLWVYIERFSVHG